tara:strand:+ start:804 stop:968 length:165 start_codon:yes stop_codon:yes gene_type:complete
MISFNSNKGMLIDTVSMIIKIWKFQFAIYLGKEKSNAEKTKQKLKESKSYDAFA